MESLPGPVVDAAANLRRSAIVAAVLGLASIVVTGVLGHAWMGVFATVGLALGALNNRMLQRSILRYAGDASMDKKRFRRGVLGRLAGVTLIAASCALVVQPDGLAVFVGLAVFQVIMLIGAAVPVFRSLRPV